MLSMQADMSMLNGDFEHFDEAGTELLAGKEVGVLETAALVAILLKAPSCRWNSVCWSNCARTAHMIYLITLLTVRMAVHH